MARFMNFGYVMTKEESARYFFLTFSEQKYNYLSQGLYSQVLEILKLQGLEKFEPLDIVHFKPVKVVSAWYDILLPSEGICADIEPEVWNCIRELIGPKEMKFWAENYSRTMLGACCGEFLMEKGIRFVPKA